MPDSARVKKQTERCGIRRAKVSDVPKIRELITFYAPRNLMLPRSLQEIYECLRDYWVCEKNGEVITCAAGSWALETSQTSPHLNQSSVPSQQ
jgi:N-acetylglutamate synthase-like GNAT family acetyltransferase